MTGNIFPFEEKLEAELEIERLKSKVRTLRQEKNAVENELSELKSKLDDKSKLKRELFLETVLASDKSVHRYTGMPSLSILNGIFSILCERDKVIKYWSGKESSKTKSY